ncbi:PilW family protein [Chromohalobacter canadensis]|uniref:Prepilin-type N-terminal cleavage/methylation domain-containing protein n=1 Tax=Chromohalobacter canadensis TaxID=141389 RepID=A0ABZ0Y8Y8_9GAMM|nr:prepilin-type N-terminal cleavage/methylation domain-containing protein [Chromohalobacter canadensis]MCK0770097.1 prepilin-type N-terminal cleavage/methylation domain-containing protein [Chromohalobacter canadensis]WQH07807.1 prepilin-type N-terminal cleavage/methylation domain-containing protein [Chromohalobacter canadensis]
MTNQHRQRGFTLIEMMISMFLGLIILGGTVSAYQAISGLREQRDGIYAVQDELVYVHRALAQAVALAGKVEVANKSELTITPFGQIKSGRYAGCPQEDSDPPWKWRVAANSDGVKMLECNDQGVLALSAPGITNIKFSVCASATHPCVGVELKYTPCREEDECDGQTLNFHLASRATSDSQGDP